MVNPRTSDPRLQRALELKGKIEAHNAEIAVQKRLYEQFVAELKDLGLTPETLDQEIEKLTAQLQELGAKLDTELEAIEEKLR